MIEQTEVCIEVILEALAKVNSKVMIKDRSNSIQEFNLTEIKKGIKL